MSRVSFSPGAPLRCVRRFGARCFCLSLSIAVVGCSTSEQGNNDGGGGETVVSDSSPRDSVRDALPEQSARDALPEDSLVNSDGSGDLRAEALLVEDRLELDVEVRTSAPESNVLRGMTSFIVTNPHDIPGLNGTLVDTDADGLGDDTEIEAALAADSRDTDGDGYGDLLEWRQKAAGFDPADPGKPVDVCPQTERGDRDGDGLPDCEEGVVGTDMTMADSDGDRIPDGIEHWFGSDPTRHDSWQDPDFDNHYTGDEIKTHSNPLVADRVGGHAGPLYSYAALGVEERADRSKCLHVKVSQVRLVTTRPRANLGGAGYNELVVLFGEGPVDDPRAAGAFKAACVRARYVAQECWVDGDDETCGLKDPASGKVVLSPEDFFDSDELARRRDAAQANRGVDPCVGVPTP